MTQEEHLKYQEIRLSDCQEKETHTAERLHCERLMGVTSYLLVVHHLAASNYTIQEGQDLRLSTT